jgi:hypothetical protein
MKVLKSHESTRRKGTTRIDSGTRALKTKGEEKKEKMYRNQKASSSSFSF